MSGSSRVASRIVLAATVVLGAGGPRVASGVVISTGACCVRGQCQIVDPFECESLEGSYQGDLTDCSACPLGGACCLPDFQCSLAFPDDCTGAGGEYQGDLTDCTACPQPMCEVSGDPCSDCDGCTCGAEVVGGAPAGELRCAVLPECLGSDPTTNCFDTGDCPEGDTCIDAVVVLGGDTTWQGVCCPTVTTTPTTTTTTLPPNDDCLAPDPIAGCEITVPFDNTGATTDGLPHAACLSFGSDQVYSDLWYCWDPPYDADVAVQTCGGTSLDTRINVYGPFADCEEAASVCPAGDGDLLECNDDACSVQSRAEFSAADGNVYLVRLGSFSMVTQGSGTFEVTCEEQVGMCPAGTPGGVCQLPKTEVDGPTGPNGSAGTTGEAVSADDFTPSVSADITHLAWWGVYVNGQMGGPVDCGPGAGDTFTVTYYLDDGGLPGAILAGPMPVENLAKCTTGESVRIGPTPGIDEYRYEADHAPVPVEAGETYWVEISNVVPDVDCDWLWRTSEEGNGTHAYDFGEGYGAQDLDQAFCYNTIRKTCRSAGYYMTHSSTENGSRDVTGELLAAAGCMEICGEVIRNTNVDDADSALESLCESPRGTQERQLARQLTALGLNCIASGYGPLCHGWADVEDLFAECNAVCESGPNAWTVDECIAAIACVNDGGDPFATPGACFNGTCSDNEAPCNERDKSNCGSPTLATCNPLPETCHDREICNAGLGICVPPGTPADPTNCKMAKMSACSVLEVGRTTEQDCSQGIRLDDETCCNDPTECDDGELCTEDQCIVGPGCTNQPIPLCCEDNTDCSNPLPTCDLGTNTCMECVKDEDCDDADFCTDDACNAGFCSHFDISGCCHDDSECLDEAAPRCEPSGHTCVECLTDDECDDADACTYDHCLAQSCDHGLIPVPPGGPCDACHCDPVTGISCDPIPGCCVTDDDCTDPTMPVCAGNVCAPVALDACETPSSVECNSSLTFDNSTFTTDPTDPPFSCHFGGSAQGVASAWITFVAQDTFACLDTNDSLVSDTLLAVYDGTCGSFVELACSEDEGNGLLSELCVGGLTPGNTYYVQVASYSGSSQGVITLNLTCGGENEPCGADNNGGCNTDSAMPPLDHVMCGQTITGNAWADGGTRDTDWYLLSVPDPDGDGFTRVRADITGSDKLLAFIVDGIATCSPSVIGDPGCTDLGAPIQPAGALVAAPGDYVVFVAAGTCDGGGIFDGIPCPGANYSVDVSCDNVTCGDGFCDTGETAGSCPADCPAVCGDGICSLSEQSGPDYCAADCCGDFVCAANEKEGPDYCKQDCCGDVYCAVNEQDGPDYCAADCCGDGLCSFKEGDGPEYCAADCCGDFVCEPNELDGPDYCALDCCPDGVCSPTEENDPAKYCAADCCPNGVCSITEMEGPQYCADCCGDGYCAIEEFMSCDIDCLVMD